MDTMNDFIEMMRATKTQYDQRCDAIISAVQSLDGLHVTLCDVTTGAMLSDGHFLIDGHYGRVAERVFPLSIVDTITMGKVNTVIFIRRE